MINMLRRPVTSCVPESGEEECRNEFAEFVTKCMYSNELSKTDCTMVKLQGKKGWRV